LAAVFEDVLHRKAAQAPREKATKARGVSRRS
jgi:hypothetical protein